MIDPAVSVATRERIIAKARAIVRECDEAIRDVEFWNGQNPNERPLDVEELRVTRAGAVRTLQQFGETVS